MPEPFFFKKEALFKKDSGTGVFLRIFKIFKNTFFKKTPPVAVSVYTFTKLY